MSDGAVSEELIDQIDEMGTVVGTVTRAEMRSNNLLHRSVFVVVRNDADELLIHQRASWKDLWPDAWDIAVSGVVAAGEAWELAAARELAEELGISAELAYLGEGSFEFADNEISEALWVPMESVREWLVGRSVCPDSMALVLPRLDAP
jgi:isopentenyldiphosphate isomerase